MKMKPRSLTKLGETIMHLEEMKKEIGKLVLEKGSTIDRRTFRRSCFSLSSSLVRRVARGRKVRVRRRWLKN